MYSLRAGEDINQQQLAETLTPMWLIDRQTGQPHAWDTAWQLLAPNLRQIAVFEFGER